MWWAKTVEVQQKNKVQQTFIVVFLPLSLLTNKRVNVYNLHYYCLQLLAAKWKLVNLLSMNVGVLTYKGVLV